MLIVLVTVTGFNLNIMSIVGLSVLELCLIVAMKHVREKRSGEPFNFDMLFQGMTRGVDRKMHKKDKKCRFFNKNIV